MARRPTSKTGGGAKPHPHTHAPHIERPSNNRHAPHIKRPDNHTSSYSDRADGNTYGGKPRKDNQS